MSRINQTEVVRKQYENTSNLSTRISIHAKYSVNKTGFGNWIFSHYALKNGVKVLELGCGTGDMWLNREAKISCCSRLILSDLSDGMVEAARKKLSACKNIEYRVIDVQQIPYEVASFDIVIANMMLYHVPDLHQGLCEIQRVLKDDGTFYCATYGEHGIMEYLSGLLSSYGFEDRTNKNFTLQNGASVLAPHFKSVIREEYEDSLAVTDTDDLADYICSLSSMSELTRVPREQFRKVLQQNMVDGVLHVPKEYGMFICRK